MARGGTRLCPQCNEVVLRRIKGACPYCGTKLALSNGRFVTGEQYRHGIRLFGLFVEILHKRGVPFAVRKGSTAWKLQLHMANELCRTAMEYLKQCAPQEDTLAFCERYIHAVMSSKTGDWIAQQPTMQKLLGNTFLMNAPRVLQQIIIEQEERKTAQRHKISGHEQDIAHLIPKLG